MRLNTFVDHHICEADPELKNRMADARWVATKIEDQMKVHLKTMSPAFIMKEVRRIYHVSISYYTTWTARDKCLQAIYGDYGASYNLVPIFCDEDPNEIVRPPPFERAIGRPRKQRIKEEYEEDIGRGKNKRRKMTCTRCKKQGHNSRTCKGLPASETGRNNNTTAAELVDSVPVD
ncbi:hypothetical protein IFM89_035683 [Coptis chinensis]|uniref:CCHC-type domain-containing protein n=1 Tax=Coptis chinensis TaxID=261450 RepID=A0A835ITT1_9MAGN|nr:hypothetical protein IFM89_035683 [Coptis chinensis]